jgi:hypothetical protein
VTKTNAPIVDAKSETTSNMRALDALALALVDHHHVWTPEQRLLYERAIALEKQALERKSAATANIRHPHLRKVAR